jgi:hypothetical protein
VHRVRILPGIGDILLNAFAAFRRRHERPQHASQLRQIDWLAARRTRLGKVDAKKIEVVFIVIMPISGFDVPCQEPERGSEQMLDVLSEHALDAVPQVPAELAFRHIGVADTVRLHRQFLSSEATSFVSRISNLSSLGQHYWRQTWEAVDS